MIDMSIETNKPWAPITPEPKPLIIIGSFNPSTAVLMALGHTAKYANNPINPLSKVGNPSLCANLVPIKKAIGNAIHEIVTKFIAVKAGDSFINHGNHCAKPLVPKLKYLTYFQMNQ